MKTFKILLPLIMFTGLTISVMAALDVPKSQETAMESICVKAIYSEGAYMPVVDLPQIEIIGFHSPSMLHAEINNGKMVPTVNLPVVEITGKKMLDQNGKTTSENSETIHDLPVIEIVAELPLKHMVNATENGHSYMAIINLPEITISVSKDLNPDLASNYNLYFTDGQSQKNLSNTEINPELVDALVKLYPEAYATKFYSLSSANCLISENRQKVCDLVIKFGDNAVEQLRTTVIKIITN